MEETFIGVNCIMKSGMIIAVSMVISQEIERLVFFLLLAYLQSI